MKLKSGYEVVSLSEEEDKKQRSLFGAYFDGLIRLIPENWLFKRRFETIADQIYDFEFKPSDIVIMTFPKSGTTWIQEIVWTMKKNFNLDNAQALESVNFRCPFIEAEMLIPFEGPQEPQLLEYWSKYYGGLKDDVPATDLNLAKFAEDPRIIKTHLPFSMFSPRLLDTCKVIFVVRNPKDVLVSFYYHSLCVRFHKYQGDFDTFFNLFVNDEVVYGPFWPFLKEGWERRNHPNFQLVHFEDLKRDPVEEISRLDKFLNTQLTKEQIKMVAEHTSFAKMRERDVFEGESPRNVIDESKGEFFRKGQVGDWKTEFSSEQQRIMDRWIRDNIKDAPFEFIFTSHP